MYISLTPMGRSNQGITFYDLRVPTEAWKCLRAFQKLLGAVDTPDLLLTALEELQERLATRPNARKGAGAGGKQQL